MKLEKGIKSIAFEGTTKQLFEEPQTEEYHGFIKRMKKHESINFMLDSKNNYYIRIFNMDVPPEIDFEANRWGMRFFELDKMTDDDRNEHSIPL